MTPYPIGYEQDYVEKASRLTTFFRIIMVIPLMIWAAFYGLAYVLSVIGAWFAIVVTGRYPEGLYHFNAGFLRFTTRVLSYYYLVTDRYPSFGGGEEPDYPVRMRVAPPLEHYSRLKTGFRAILAIPVAIVVYVLQLWLTILAIAAWFVIVVTGKLPEGIADLMRLPMAYQIRANAYYGLVTEAFPPFDDGRPQVPAAPDVPALPGL